MARLLVMYKTPRDPAAFDKHYAEKHVPLAQRIPGVRKFEKSTGVVATPGGPSAYHLVAILHFDDMAAIQKAFASPEGQAAAADAQALATGGVDFFMFENTGG
ncbi:MAG TPA: EthD family reductase [Xanthobacteraceae bacterium]|nr:EthD family reductase [Xanthobacteraceae bacterium]